MTLRRWPPRDSISRPKLILCEGPSDEAFFRALIDSRMMNAPSIRHTGDSDRDNRGGISKFGGLLQAVSSYPGFENVTDVLIIADNDDDPPGNFSKVREQILSAQRGGSYPPQSFPAPLEPRQAVGQNPTITVLMIPWDTEPGNLECLCLSPAYAGSPHLRADVESFAQTTGAAAWPQTNSRGKMQLRSLLAAAHQPDPFIGLGNIWKANATLIPLNDGSLDEVSGFLAGFLA